MRSAAHADVSPKRQGKAVIRLCGSCSPAVKLASGSPSQLTAGVTPGLAAVMW
jgi:hypothetical protein